jgi:hypothetical protein
MCGVDITYKRVTARTCSPKCRKDLSRLESVTPNVTLSDEFVTLDFEFYTQTKSNEHYIGNKSPTRKARYWYDVPLAAHPVIKKGWPTCPSWMNGRQYFLWWKNDFAYDMDAERPLILNPFRKVVE